MRVQYTRTDFLRTAVKKETDSQLTWKHMFRFTKDGRMQSMDLMYAFFLGLGELFVCFIIGNRLTILFEAFFPSISRTAKNILDILIPAILCALIAWLLFRLIRKKKTVLMSYWFGLILTVIIFVIILIEFDRETTELLIPAYIGIFVIPAAVCAAAVTILFRNWLQNNPDPLREEEGSAEQPAEEISADPEGSEPDYSGWKQFR